MLVISFWEKGCDIFLSVRQFKLLANTFLVGIGTAFFSLSLGGGVAFLVERTNVYGKKIIRVLTLLPLFIPPYIYALTWIKVFPETSFFLGVNGTIIMLTFAFFPFFFLMVSC